MLSFVPANLLGIPDLGLRIENITTEKPTTVLYRPAIPGTGLSINLNIIFWHISGAFCAEQYVNFTVQIRDKRK